jgi:death-on-curing protein
VSEPVWLPERAVYIIHDRQITRHGGASGLRDSGLLTSALQRPINKLQYEKAGLFKCAAAYAYGIAKAHAFVDGNKRTAFVSGATFLRLNGWHFKTEPAEGVEFMEGLVSDAITKEKFENWLIQGSTKIV